MCGGGRTFEECGAARKDNVGIKRCSQVQVRFPDGVSQNLGGGEQMHLKIHLNLKKHWRNSIPYFLE